MIPAPLRSLLFTPATRPDRVRHLVAARPDATILDLEDAVAPHDKEHARSSLETFVAALHEADPELPIFVRVNDATSQWWAFDLAAVPLGTAGVVIPKVEGLQEVRDARDALAHHGDDLSIIGGIETAKGIVAIDSIADAGLLDGVYFGAEDFVTDVGGRRTASNHEVHYARSRIVVACRAAEVVAIDQAVTSIGDEETFLADAHIGRDLGFHAKLCIHPSQVALVHAVYAPGPEELAWAQEVLDAIADGAGTAVVRGQMVDAPIIRRAHSIRAAMPSP